jgi:hypothetical protein
LSARSRGQPDRDFPVGPDGKHGQVDRGTKGGVTTYQKARGYLETATDIESLRRLPFAVKPSDLPSLYAIQKQRRE